MYPKLVRDKIPEIIIRDNLAGTKVVTENLNHARYIQFLNSKLSEEVGEYFDEYNPDELIDILEVVFALAKVNGISETELMARRNGKLETRGGFDKKILLKDVTIGSGIVFEEGVESENN